MKLLTLMALVLVLLSGMTLACNIEINSLATEVRADGDYYYSSISAPKSQDIDIKISFDVDSYSGSDCPTNLTVKAVIKKYNSTTNAWESFKTSSSKSQELSNDSFVFVWSNEFNTGSSSNYSRYKVEGSVLNGSSVLDTEEAYVDIVDNSCTGIKLTTSAITIDEGRSTTKNFTIQNNTDEEFSLDSMDVYFSNSLIRSGNVDYDSYVPAHSSRTISITLDAGYVSSTTTVTGTLAVDGDIDGEYCSSYDIGRKNFDVTVRNVSSNDYDDGDYYSSSSSADCDEIEIQTWSASMDEGTTQKIIFGVKNYSSKRFEILEVSSTSSGLQISPYFNEKYVYPSQISDIVLNVSAPQVSTNKAFENTLKIKGRFDDGRTCSFSDIASKNFVITVADSTGSTAPTDCGSFGISVQSSIEIENYGSLPFTITNGTTQIASVIVEGTVNATPTVIVVPAKSSLSRQINISINDARGELRMIPQINGCSAATKIVQVINTAKGEISQVSLSAESQRDDQKGEILISVKINNPSTKTFEGVLSVEMPSGWQEMNKEVTINQGTNLIEFALAKGENAQEGTITIEFISGGERLTAQTNTFGTNPLTGFFTFGSAGALGIILLAVIVVILIVGLLGGFEGTPNETEQNQGWVKKNN